MDKVQKHNSFIPVFTTRQRFLILNQTNAVHKLPPRVPKIHSDIALPFVNYGLRSGINQLRNSTADHVLFFPWVSSFRQVTGLYLK
jgi:hypothetical protein